MNVKTKRSLPNTARQAWLAVLCLLLFVSCGVQSGERDTTKTVNTPNTAESIYDEQTVDVDLSYYYGEWKIGEMVGDGYIYADIDEEKCYGGGVLIIEKETITYVDKAGNAYELQNPTYIFTLVSPSGFMEYRRSNFSSFAFHNAYVVRIDIFDGEEIWNRLTPLYG